MVCERYDGADWPATISVGPGWYGLRIDTDHGTAVEYVDASSLTRRARKGPSDGQGETARRDGRYSFGAHAGARCEEAA